MVPSAFAACLNISDVPYETTALSAPPNIMIVLDNSGSMDWEFLTDDYQGKFEGQVEYLFDDPGDNNYKVGISDGDILSGADRAKWKSQWAGYNKLYYNPMVDYLPWPNFSNADTSTPRSNPANATPIFDLNGEYYAVSDATPISIKNAHYYSWDDADVDGDLDSSESVYLVNFVGGLREYYRFNDLNANDVVEPGELTSVLQSALPDTVKPKLYDEEGNFVGYKTDTQDLQNFANWYSFYRRRELTAKAALSNLIAGLVGVQVGFYSINDGLRQPVLPVKVDMGLSVIVDNQDSGYQESGNWTASSAATAYNGTARYTANTGDYATWTPDLAEAGTYNVYGWWDYLSTRDENALYTISHTGGENTVRVNQRENHTQWTLIGTFQFATGTSGSVTVTRDNMSNGTSTSADALMFELVGGGVKVDETDTLLNLLYSLDSDGTTPLRNALDAVGQYFHQDDGQDGGLGDSPYEGSEGGGACQQAFAIVMTDGYYNGTAPVVGNQDQNQGSPYADAFSNTLADVAMKYYKDDLASSLDNEVPTNSCDSANHQHMVTYAVSFGVTGTLSPADNDGDGQADDPCFLDSGTPAPSWPDPEGGDKEKIDDLWHAAVNGRGAFYSASNPEELIRSLKSLFENIVARRASGASVSVNGERLITGTVVYQASFNSSNWTGDVTAYPVDPITGEILRGNDDILWHASDMLQNLGWNDRRIVSYNEVSGGIPFRYTSLSAEQRTALDPDWETDDTTAQNTVDYLRGREFDGFRPRSRKLGDIVHSAPLLVGSTIYVGANDGMLHAFNVETGIERFAYVPNLVFDRLKYLKDNDYEHRSYVDSTPVAVRGVGSSGHTLLVGGLGKGGKGYYVLDLSIADAIDATTSEAAIANTVLWEYPRPGITDNDMGYSYSRALIVRSYSSAHEWVVIFGNGYDSENGKAVLYVLDLDGNLIKKMDTGVGGCNGLSTPALVDVNADFKVDYAYVGDLKGNLWKFDFTDPDPANWDVAFSDGTDPKPLFQATGQPITTKPDVMRHPEKAGYIVVFGTGKFMQSGDRSDTDVQTVYGIWDYGDDDDDSEYLGSFNRASGILSNQPSNVTLLRQTEIDFRTVSGHDLRTLSDNPAIWETIDDADSGQDPDPGSIACTDGQDNDGDTLVDEPDECIAHAGWYFDFPRPGERVIIDVLIRDGKAIFVSSIPSVSPCSGGGDSMIHEVDPATGSRSIRVQFDIYDDRMINEQDRITVGETSMAPTGKGYSGILHPPVILRMPEGKREMKIFSTSAGATETLFEIAEKRGISYWRER
jgi:Tfp pilus tip-associated adhesin PilY1